MRILVLGNMANDGYAVVKEFRKMNVEADLAINVSDFGMGLPEWEDADLPKDLDPYSIDHVAARKAWNAPPWIRYFDFKNNLPPTKHIAEKIQARINVIKIIREYDIVEAHIPFSIYCQFSGVPYVAYDAGWIRYFPFGRNMRDKLARRGYSKAKKIIMTNPDTFEIFDRLKYLDQNRVLFSPFAIDPEKYRSLNAKNLRSRYAKENEILLFCPARQIWVEKGNDKMIRAYAKFVKEIPNSKFIMVSWSVDKENSMALANSLGISDKIEWINPVPKNRLIEYYNAADIILDQFVLGSWGTSTPEAMSCGKPVLMYYKKEHIMRAFGEEPPILNSFTEDDICQNLLRLAKDVDYLADVGKKSREWIIKTHSSRVVAQRHLEILRSCL